MPLRSALVNLAITFALLLAVVVTGIIMRARQEQSVLAKEIPMAGVLGGMGEAGRGLPKSRVDQFDTLLNPVLVETSTNKGDTLRVRHGSRNTSLSSTT